MISSDANFSLDQAYFSNFYTDLSAQIEKWRRRLIPVGISISLTGFLIAINARGYEFLGMLLICFGLGAAFSQSKIRKRWIDSHLNSKTLGVKISIAFNQDMIEYKDKYAEMKLSWDSFEEIIEARNGLLFRVKKSSFWYIPKSAIQPSSAIREIIERHKSR